MLAIVCLSDCLYAGHTPDKKGNQMKQHTTDRTETEQVIASMLVEPTPTSIVDSGGYYGRHWQRNAGITLEQWRATPTISIDKWGASISVFHYLTQRLEFVKDLNDEWTEFSESRDDYWLNLMQEFAERYDSEAHTFNTYNGGGYDLLSQVIQGVTFERDGESFILLQIHGGCDVRGGYTRPQAFRVLTTEGFFPYDYDSYSLSCDSGEREHDVDYRDEWTSYHGYALNDDESPRFGDGTARCALCDSTMTGHAPEPY